jgi:hypothetical protein
LFDYKKNRRAFYFVRKIKHIDNKAGLIRRDICGAANKQDWEKVREFPVLMQ